MHTQGLKDPRLLDIAQSLARDAFDDLGCQEDALALIGEVRSRQVQQIRMQGALDEGRHGSVRPPQLGVLGQHVRHPGDMRQDLPHRDLTLIPAGEFWQMLLNRIVEGDKSLVDELHQSTCSDGLGDRGEKKNRICLDCGRTRFGPKGAEAAR